MIDPDTANVFAIVFGVIVIIYSLVSMWRKLRRR